MHQQIALTGKWGLGHVAIVDEEDYMWLAKHRCRLTKNGYVATSVVVDDDYREIPIHRLIMERHAGPLGSQCVDHISGNRLDNRRVNLRITDHQGNARNASSRSARKTSRYKGVHKVGSRYYAGITVNGVGVGLGSYASERDAALVYNLKAKEVFGQFARLNDIPTAPDDEDRLRALMSDPRTRNGWASRYRDVQRSGKTTWRARVGRVHIGTYDTEEEAAAAAEAYRHERAVA